MEIPRFKFEPKKIVPLPDDIPTYIKHKLKSDDDMGFIINLLISVKDTKKITKLFESDYSISHEDKLALIMLLLELRNYLQELLDHNINEYHGKNIIELIKDISDLEVLCNALFKLYTVMYGTTISSQFNNQINSKSTDEPSVNNDNNSNNDANIAKKTTEVILNKNIPVKVDGEDGIKIMEKLYTCDVCRAYSHPRKSNVERHKKIHDRPESIKTTKHYICEFCGHDFKNKKYNLERHLTTCSKNTENDEKSDKKKTIPKNIPNNTDILQNDGCISKVFADKIHTYLDKYLSTSDNEKPEISNQNPVSPQNMIKKLEEQKIQSINNYASFFTGHLPSVDFTVIKKGTFKQMINSSNLTHVKKRICINVLHLLKDLITPNLQNIGKSVSWNNIPGHILLKKIGV